MSGARDGKRKRPSAAVVAAPASRRKERLSPIDQQETEKRRERLLEELERCEGSIFELEQGYLEDTLGGNAVRGWRADSRGRPNAKASSDEDMLFSKSSLTSPLYRKSKGKKAE